MKHIEKAESKHLDKILSDIREGKYVIPDFQREFEWNPWDVNGLITSIFMDYYIGTLLLWKASDENVRVLSCEAIKGYKGTLRPEHIVLDGQQRLTAMYFAFFNPDEPYPKRKSRCFFFMNIAALIEENFEDAFYYQWETKYFKEFIDTPSMQFEQNVLPLGVIGRGTWEIMDWIKDYKSYWEQQKQSIEQVDTSNYSTQELETHQNKLINVNRYLEFPNQLKSILQELLNDYNLSYIELDRAISVAKVCDIFTNINSKGVPLNIFDLLNAILRPHDIYLKDMWRNVADELDYTDQDKMKIYVFQVMSILEQTYCSSKYLYYLVPEAVKTVKEGGFKKQIVLIKNKEEFEAKWMAAVESLKKSIKALKSPRDFGAITPTFVPYPSIIPAFTAIKAHIEKTGYRNILDVNSKIRKWYWSSIFTLNYSSSVESTSAKDFGDLKKWFDDDTEEPENYIKFVQELENQDFKKQNQKGSAIYNAIFNILILNEARDWYTADLPEYETLDDHHIVPHSWGKKHVGNDINSILNKTPLSPATNRFVINDRMPFDYLKEMKENNGDAKFYGIMESHLISKKATEILMRNPFTKDDYFEFLSEREKSVKSYLQSKIIEDKIPLSPQLRDLDTKIESLELKLRDLIAEKINDDQFNTQVPPHVLEKVNKRIQNTLRKNPGLSPDNFRQSRKRLDYFDLQEYCDLIISRDAWEMFEPTFRNKQLLQERFSKLGELRNSIRHSRDVSEVTILEGKAAIVWFSEII